MTPTRSNQTPGVFITYGGPESARKAEVRVLRSDPVAQRLELCRSTTDSFSHPALGRTRWRVAELSYDRCDEQERVFAKLERDD